MLDSLKPAAIQIYMFTYFITCGRWGYWLYLKGKGSSEEAKHTIIERKIERSSSAFPVVGPVSCKWRNSLSTVWRKQWKNLSFATCDTKTVEGRSTRGGTCELSSRRRQNTCAGQGQFFWPGYSVVVKEWCKTCVNCATRKVPPRKRRAPLQNILTGYPMQIVAADIVGPFPTTANGNRYILVASDYFAKCLCHSQPGSNYYSWEVGW